MKLIILEGGDRLGKSTLIEGICKKLNYDNVTIRHFGKPPANLKGDAAFGFQMTCFQKEAELVNHMKNLDEDDDFSNHFFKYEYDNVMIWNRSHLGEYVYAQMFRGGHSKFIREKLIDFEIGWLTYDDLDTYLITLTADPHFFLKNEDGKSFSQNIDQKTRELELFKEAHDFSILDNKLIYKVDNGDGQFKTKQEILDQVIEFTKI